MSERVLICGDRNWTNFEVILRELSRVQLDRGVEVVIEGENGTYAGFPPNRRVVKGADLMGRAAAERLGIPVLPYAADWRKHGKAAGPIRNRQMLTEGKPTLVLAFHDFLDASKGTKDMVNAARNAGVPAQIVTQRGQ